MIVVIVKIRIIVLKISIMWIVMVVMNISIMIVLMKINIMTVLMVLMKISSVEDIDDNYC